MLFSECIKTNSKDQIRDRLWLIYSETKKIISEYGPDVVAMESLFFGKNQKTALGVAEARGAILIAITEKNLPLYEYKPAEIKSAVTGFGNSDKKSVIKLIPLLIKIDKKIKEDDEYDAVAVALTCIARERFNTK